MGAATADRVLVGEFTDGLGVRRRTTDSLGRLTEVLTLHDDLVGHPCFEFAVRERVLRLSEFQHRAFPPVLGVDRVAPRSVTITSAAAKGVRLSALVGPHTAANVPWSLRVAARVLHALAALHALGPEIAHGGVCARRLYVTQDGEISVGDYMLGSALMQLRYAPDRYRTELDIALPMQCDGLDHHVDVFQTALVALELVAGRRLTDAERCGEAATRQLLARLRAAAGFERQRAGIDGWLAQALQISSPFASSAEALDEIDAIELPRDSDNSGSVEGNELPSQCWHTAETGSAREIESPITFDAAAALSPPGVEAGAIASDRGAAIDGAVTAQPEQWQALPVAPEPHRREATDPRRRLNWLFQSTSVAAVVVVAMLCALFYSDARRAASHTTVMAAGRPPARASSESTAPAEATLIVDHADLRPVAYVGSTGQTPDAIAPGAKASPQTVRPAAMTVPPGQAASQEHPPTGSLTITSPFEFKAFEHGRMIANSDRRRVTLAAGTHDLVFMNGALGLRMTKHVNVIEGRSTTVALDAPIRLVAINADPWADVIIDGLPVGQTPLGGVPIPVGLHDVVFRHPSLGEQRRDVRVPATGEVRVSVHMK